MATKKQTKPTKVKTAPEKSVPPAPGGSVLKKILKEGLPAGEIQKFLAMAAALTFRDIVTDILQTPEEAYQAILDQPELETPQTPGAMAGVKVQVRILLEARRKLVEHTQNRIAELGPDKVAEIIRRGEQ